MVNGAWKKHLTDLYGPRGRQLALAFLKCPPAMVDTLLWQWHEYMNSPEYTQERDRARKHRTEANKQSEVEAKLKVYRLRHQRRLCNRLRRKLIEGIIQEVPYSQRDLYERFVDGRLDIEIDEATKNHGYGAFGPQCFWTSVWMRDSTLTVAVYTLLYRSSTPYSM